MDLSKLELTWAHLAARHEAWRVPIREAGAIGDETLINRVRRQQLARYNPWQAAAPVRDAMLAHYAETVAERRAAMRGMVRQNPYISEHLLGYMADCAECMTMPQDGDALKAGLIAAALENYGGGNAPATLQHIGLLGRSASSAGIDIDPIAQEVVCLCAPHIVGKLTVRHIIERLETYTEKYWKNHHDTLQPASV